MMAQAPTSSPQGASPGVQREYTSYIGMVIILAVFAMMFAALFFAYAVARANAMSWPPPGETRLPVALPALNTVVLLASSVTMHKALATIRNWRVVELPRWIVATAVLGALFLGLQLYVWKSMWDTGLRVDSGIYGSVFWALTTVHAAHVAGGLVALGVIAVPAFRGQYRKNRHTPVRLVAMFWHFIDVVWVLMFLGVYVF